MSDNETTENQPLTEEQYEEQYDKLWNEANGVEETTDSEEDESPIEQPTEPNEDTDEQSEEPTTDEVVPNTDEDNTEPAQESKVFKIKAMGTELELTEDEIKILASKGIDYTAKTKQLAKYRQIIELTKDISTEELNVLKDLKNGNKEAIIKLANDYDIDLYDLDTDKEPEINDYSTNPTQIELQEVENRIMADTDTLPKVKQVLDIIPQEFKEVMTEQPQILEGLYSDIKDGIGEPIVKEALKTYAIYGGDFLKHYVNAGEKIVSQNQQQEITPQEKSIKNKASIPNTKNIGSGKKDYLADAQEIWDMPSEDFRKVKAKVLAKVGMKI